MLIFVGQYGMFFVSYAITVKSKFWVVKAKHQIPNLKKMNDFKDCENGYLTFILKWLSFYKVNKP